MQNKESTPTATPAEDVMIGAAPIARFLGVPPRQVYYLAAQKRLPVGHLGNLLIASRRRLARHMDRIAAGEPRGKESRT